MHRKSNGYTRLDSDGLLRLSSLPLLPNSRGTHRQHLHRVSSFVVWLNIKFWLHWRVTDIESVRHKNIATQQHRPTMPIIIRGPSYSASPSGKLYGMYSSSSSNVSTTKNGRAINNNTPGLITVGLHQKYRRSIYRDYPPSSKRDDPPGNHHPQPSCILRWLLISLVILRRVLITIRGALIHYHRSHTINNNN